MAVFYCPSDLDNVSDATPKVCKSYLTARARLTPAVLKYYNEYASPYVQAVKPHAERAHEKVVKPAGAFAERHYRTYGEPHVERGIEYSRRRWQDSVDPKLREYQRIAHARYDAHIAHRARRVCAATAPHHETVRAVFRFVRHHFNFIRSFYVDRYNRHVYPVLLHAYDVSYDVTTTRVLPYLKRVSVAFVEFLNGPVRGHVSGLYSQNVEPQLVRISQKLASYREAQENKAKPTGHEGVSRSATGARLTSADASESSARRASQAATAAAAPGNNNPDKRISRKEINQDLSDFEARLTAAAKKGSASLYERVSDIVAKKSESDPAARLEEMIAHLETVVKQELGALRNKTKTANAAQEGLPVESGLTGQQESLDHFKEAVKSSGSAIRNAAQEIRSFVSDLDSELVTEVSSSVNTTVEVLASVRDLSLQQVSAKWAYVDGVVYEDWEKYHALKRLLSQWQSDLTNVAFLHKGLVELRGATDALLVRGVAIAEDAAVELKKIKEDGLSKIQSSAPSQEAQLADQRSAGLVADEGSEKGVVAKDQHVLRASNDATQDAATISKVPPKESTLDTPSAAVASSSDGGADIDAALKANRSRDVVDLEQTHHKRDVESPSSSSSESPSTSSSPNSVAASASSASSKLSHELHQATQALQRSIDHASTSLAVPENPDVVLLDAKRRYYEAIGLAHDKFYAVFMSSSAQSESEPSQSEPPTPAPASSTASATHQDGTATARETSTSRPSPSPSPPYPDVTESPVPQYPEQRSQRVIYANEEYSSISSMLSNSLDAVIYSINSVATQQPAAATASVLADASARQASALSAAASSRSSVEVEAGAGAGAGDADADATAPATESGSSCRDGKEVSSPQPTTTTTTTTTEAGATSRASEEIYTALSASESKAEAEPTEAVAAQPQPFPDSKTDGESSGGGAVAADTHDTTDKQNDNVDGGALRADKSSIKDEL